MIANETLSHIGLFDGIPEGQLTSIGEISEEVSYSQGKQVFQEGSKAARIYFLLEGKVSIKVSLTTRLESVTVTVINQPFQSLGWSGAVPPYHYTASAHCEEDCRLLAMDGQKMIEILKLEPESGFLVMQRISQIIGNRLRDSRLILLKTL